MIAAVETAMIERLKSFSDASLPGGAPFLGYRYTTLETYPADWDAFLAEKRQINPPGLWLGFAGASRVVETSSGALRHQCSFGLTVIAANQRNEQARRHGFEDAGEVGSYQLIEDAIGILAGSNLGGLLARRIETGQIRHVRPAAALLQRKASMMAAELKVEFALPMLGDLPHEEDPVPFEIFHANWDIAPFGGIDANAGQPGIQLPDDAHADATDHVELEQ